MHSLVFIYKTIYFVSTGISFPKKNSNVWEEKSIMSVMWKINNTWTSTTSSMSGKTAFKVIENT